MKDIYVKFIKIIKIMVNNNFLRIILFSFVILLSLQISAKDYQLVSGSMLEWEAKKVTGMHNGTISFQSGTLEVSKGKISGGKLIVDMSTIADLDLKEGGFNQKLVGHLKSDDFFAVDKFPVSILEVTQVNSVSGDNYQFLGTLTIKGITQPVEFQAKVTANSKDLKAVGIMTVNRSKYDIRYRSGSFFSDLGDKLIYDDFTLKFNIEARGK